MLRRSTNSRLVLVTGAEGFIGAHLTEALVRMGWSVLAVDKRYTAAPRQEQRIARQTVDVADREFNRLVRGSRPDAVIHLAAQSSLAALEREPGQGLRDNVLATANLVDACALAGVRKVVFASSAAVYGQPEELPVREDAPLKPLSAYGWSKAAGEQLIVRGAKQHGFAHTILRLSNVYGPGQELKSAPGVITLWFDALLESRPLAVAAGGSPTRDFVYVSDVVEAIAAALVQGNGETLNVSSGHEMSLAKLAALVAENSGQVVSQITFAGPPGEVERSVLDPTRARHALGWKALTPLELGIRRTWTHMVAGRRRSVIATG